MRDEIKASIVDGTFTAAKVAQLNSEDLATAEQLAQIEAARAESLRQTVRLEEEYAAVRIGRDGFEEVARRTAQRPDPTAEEAEKQGEEEWAPRTPRDEPRRESIATVESPKSPKASLESPKSPVHRRRSSLSIPHSPITQHRPSVEFASAWGAGAASAEALETVDQDQDAIDLSDIAGAEVSYDDGLDGAVEVDPMGEFLSRPVVWSGGVSSMSPHNN